MLAIMYRTLTRAMNNPRDVFLMLLITISHYNSALSTSSETTQSSTQGIARKGLDGYSRFHANDSLIGQPVPCTRQEKICFRHNLIYNTKSQKCVELQEESNYYCRGDRNEFLDRSGHFIAACSHQHGCPRRLGRRFAHDGVCYSWEVMRDVICGCDAEPTLHMFGGVECRCTPSELIHVEQPEEEARCHIPDLRFPKRSDLFRFPYVPQNGNVTKYNCSTEQKRCFSNSTIWVPELWQCRSPLSTADCPANHVVGLRREALSKGVAEGDCVPKNGGCSEGEIRMASDGQCHDEEEMKLLAPDNLQINFLTEYTTRNSYSWGYTVISYTPVIDDDKCGINETLFHRLVIPLRPPPPEILESFNPQIIESINANRPQPE